MSFTGKGAPAMADKTVVRIEVTDPTDGATHVFEGPDEISAQRQVDAFFGVDEADRRERGDH